MPSLQTIVNSICLDIPEIRNSLAKSSQHRTRVIFAYVESVIVVSYTMTAIRSIQLTRQISERYVQGSRLGTQMARLYGVLENNSLLDCNVQ
ncbi:hypothetical protein [Testudinid alphaherpesvirus 3]|uniref:Uncharacterized protein n=1 Tax=Testudinid alphaherpesvirus 3 TaxID=2560801 RepID=A0A0K1R131_9ALPH|nr:hypothetical protein [Testudinid alphaherpesvirus 3]